MDLSFDKSCLTAGLVCVTKCLGTIDSAGATNSIFSKKIKRRKSVYIEPAG